VKNGTIHSGKPKWKCKDCQRQFVATPAQPRIPDEIKRTIDKLLPERISLAGIVRVTLRDNHSTPTPPYLKRYAADPGRAVLKIRNSTR